MYNYIDDKGILAGKHQSVQTRKRKE